MRDTNMNKNLLSGFLAILVMMAVSSCSTGHLQKPEYRKPSAAGSEVVDKFVGSLTKSMSDEEAVAFSENLKNYINDNHAKFNIDKVDGEMTKLEDLKNLSEADQEKLVKELSTDVSLQSRMRLSENAMNEARIQALRDADASGAAVKTEKVADLHGSSDAGGAHSSTMNVASFPMAYRAIAGKILSDEQLIEQKGLKLIGSGCSTIENETALENLQAISDDVANDVKSGKIRSQAELNQETDEEIAKATHVDEETAHERRCQLAESPNKQGASACNILARAAGCE